MTPFLWHGLLMWLAWFLLLPAGAVIARFYKVRPSQPYPYALDDKFWWNAHRLIQSAGAALAAAAAWLIWQALDGEIEWQVPHVQLGVGALWMLAIQLLSPLFRGSKGGPTDVHADPYDPATWRGDHFDMTRRRRIFEFLHKRLGYVGMAAAVGAAWTGVELAGLDAWWRACVVVPALGFVALFAYLTMIKRRVATWDAIWGPYGR